MDNNGSKTLVQESARDTACGEGKGSCPFTALINSKAYNAAQFFLKDYIERHAHPINAALHVIGVPAAFAGFFYFFTGRDIPKGAALIFIGYLLQYLGHRAQGNEVGEVTLAKNIYRRVK